LVCPAAIKPGVDKVEHHYRNCHRVVGKSPPIPELETYAGFSCRSCRHLARDRSNRDRYQADAKHWISAVGDDQDVDEDETKDYCTRGGT
ncbi:hypothetical protein FOC4_g10000988, partial [Fusarium odoratissimum]